jgi:predicted Zn-dependent peptidase
MEKFLKTKLENGTRVILVPEKNTDIFTILLMVGTGSKYETKEEAGISHFLEHMFFKGTKKRPNPKELSEPLDSAGGIYNAFTSQEFTGFYVKITSQKRNLALEWMADIFFNSLFKEEEIEKEKGVVIEELNMINDDPMKRVQILWQKVLYGDQPAGRPIVGEKETIKNFNREMLLKYKNEQYVAQNLVLGASGNFDKKEILKKIKKYFGKVKPGKKREKPKLIEDQKKPEVLLEEKKVDQCHLILGHRGVNLFDKRKYVQEVLATILGGMMSSRLFQKIREEMGIAYYIFSESFSDLDSGYLGIYAGLKIEETERGIKEILNELKKMKFEISKKEMKKAKENIKGKFDIFFESAENKLHFYVLHELLENKILTKEEFFKNIEKITLNQLKDFAKEFFVPEKLNLALIHPSMKKEDLEKILKL